MFVSMSSINSCRIFLTVKTGDWLGEINVKQKWYHILKVALNFNRHGHSLEKPKIASNSKTLKDPIKRAQVKVQVHKGLATHKKA